MNKKKKINNYQIKKIDYIIKQLEELKTKDNISINFNNGVDEMWGTFNGTFIKKALEIKIVYDELIEIKEEEKDFYSKLML